LHGDTRGSVDREHNVPGTPYLSRNSRPRQDEQQRLKHRPYQLSEQARRIALRAIWEVCEHRGWDLLAAHVRSTHLHVVVTADAPPERVMNDFKSYSSRALNSTSCDDHREYRWTRHGSTRYLNRASETEAAVDYVMEQQGRPMIKWSLGDPEPTACTPRP